MHLEQLKLRNFRSCDETIIRFNEDLTIIAGENNGGKTTVLDALRLVTTPTTGRRTRYPTPRDIRYGSNAPMELEAVYSGLSDAQLGLFYVALASHAVGPATYGYIWTPPAAGSRRSKPALTAGPRGAPDPEPDARELIRHVHLPALRDAARDLASSSPGRIEFLLRHLIGDSEAKETALLEATEASFSSLLTKDEVLKDASARVQRSFRPFTDGFHTHEAYLGFSEPSLTGLARDLRFTLAMHGLDPTDLAQSGLGYANLLYLASVLVELDTARDAELTVLLVEEPEAHLHPQLQAVTLDFLRRKANESKTRLAKEGEHSGRIQVVATTHSPNISSSVSSTHVVVLRATPTGHNAGAEEQASEEALPPRPPATRAISVGSLEVPIAQLRKVDRYLDVTRSSLLFSRRALLVEGIAEGLLVPVFARHLFKPRPDAWTRFLAASIVAIDGVDFEPYVRLLLTHPSEHTETISERVVVITDEDPGAKDVDAASGDARKATLLQLAEDLDATGRLEVIVTPVTFEAALVRHCGDDAKRLSILETAFATLLAKAGHQAKRREVWAARIQGQEPSAREAAFMNLLASTNTRKGDFAQSLAQTLEDEGNLDAFGVPDPIENALNCLVESS